MRDRDIEQILEGKRLRDLLEIIKEAKDWIERPSEGARNVLLDEPHLRFALFHVSRIIERRYQEIDSGARSLTDEMGPQGHGHPRSRNAPGPRPQYGFGPPPPRHPGGGYPGPPPPGYPPPGYDPMQGYVPPGYDQMQGYRPPPAYGQAPAYQMPAYAPPPPPGYPPPPAYSAAPRLPDEAEEVKARVLSMTDEEIGKLDPDTRQQVEEVRAQLKRGGP